MDSLGGILTKGLLGNPILAHFNLFFEILIVEPTPTPSPTPTPTPTPVPGDHDARGGAGGVVDEKKPDRTVKIVIKFKSKEYSGLYTLNDRKLRVTINILNYLNKAAVKMREFAVKLKRPTP